ncbi:MAG: NADH-quinone oxidoreductase subunit I, partial [Nitrospirae bacterium]|nr:NADH-quinone oxidoreductase subunit I [Nitrospirota bacterium]
YRIAGLAVEGRGKGEGPGEEPPVDVKGLLP